MFRVTKQQGTTAVFQQFGYLPGLKSGVERNRRISAGDDAQISRDPAGMIVSENGNAGAGRKGLFPEPAANRLRHPPKFGVAVALDPVATLDLESNLVRPALRTLAKAVVEGGHGSAGNIPENTWNRRERRVRRENRGERDPVDQLPATCPLPLHLIC